MKAIVLKEYGNNLKLENIPRPIINDDEILVKVKNSGVNHVDAVEASGLISAIFPIELPWIPGREFSGIIEETGKNVKSFKAGDAVFGNSELGAYAEYLALKPEVIVLKPDNISFEEAASVPVASQTAWQGVFTHGGLAKGQTILIHGGAGAVGAYAVQFAHNAGAKVIATASSRDALFLQSIGVDQVIDYRSKKFEDEITEKVDVVFDLVGGDTQQRSYEVLKKGGRLVSTVQPVSKEEATKHNVNALMMRLEPSTKKLDVISRLLEEKKVHPDVAKIYPLERAAEAWQDMSGNLSSNKGQQNIVLPKISHGKLILKVA